jgi:antitoxin (DNA-binding transcriptional repressor) of toxin-antitoxin stability system
VTRHGKPVARIIAAEVADMASRTAAVDAIFRNLTELSRGVRLDGDLKQIARDGLD